MDFIHVSPYNTAKIAYPVLQPIPSAIASVRVLVDGEIITDLERIESFSLVAQDAFQSKSDLLYAKANMRAISKALGIGIWDTITEDKSGKEGVLYDLLGVVFRVGRDSPNRHARRIICRRTPGSEDRSQEGSYTTKWNTNRNKQVTHTALQTNDRSQHDNPS